MNDYIIIDEDNDIISEFQAKTDGDAQEILAYETDGSIGWTYRLYKLVEIKTT